jgi:hypothetical protein
MDFWLTLLILALFAALLITILIIWVMGMAIEGILGGLIKGFGGPDIRKRKR